MIGEHAHLTPHQLPYSCCSFSHSRAWCLAYSLS